MELIREQAALSTDPELLSQRIDEIAATLGGTAQWIRDQQQVYGAMEDLLTEPPPVARRGTRAEGEPVSHGHDPATAALPAWAAELRDLFRSGSTAQFLLHGNVFDLVPAGGRLLSLKAFLDEVMFAGLRRRAALRPQPRRPRDARRRGLGRLARAGARRGGDGRQTLSLVREPGSALELDRSLPAAHPEPARRWQARAPAPQRRSRSSSTSPSSSCRAATRCSSAAPSAPTS